MTGLENRQINNTLKMTQLFFDQNIELNVYKEEECDLN